MNYLLMICGAGDAGAESRGATEEVDDSMQEVDAWVTEMDGRGVRLLGRPLDPPQTAATVRVRDGETLVSDGPFAESKEFVAGFDILSCADLDEALEVAARHPVARFGAVEVRPFRDGFEFPAAAREWAAAEPGDSWAQFFCADGIPEADEVEAAIDSASVAWGQRLEAQGTLVCGHPLAHVELATTVRVRDGEAVVSDGPFVETKEFIAGFAVLHGVTRPQAIQAAAEHPLAALHRVEVRRFMET